MHLISRYLLILLLAVGCYPLVAQERAELEQCYQTIIERPLGVAPAISDSAWGQLIQKALDKPDSTVTLQTKSQGSLEMRIDKAAYLRTYTCTLAHSGRAAPTADHHSGEALPCEPAHSLPTQARPAVGA